MLNILRKQAQSPLIQAMVVVIAIVFIFWGFGGRGNSSRTAVATVNGEEISYQEYGQEYERTVENFRRQFFAAQVRFRGIEVRVHLFVQGIKLFSVRRKSFPHLFRETGGRAAQPGFGGKIKN